jgi:steroid delta-isomerase-like uncharacterized protein
MSEKNVAIVRRWVEELDKHNFEIIDEVVSPDIQFYYPGTMMEFEAYKQYVYSVYEALPDLHHTIEDLFAKGDRVVLRATDSGTHLGEFMGVPPTGNQVTVTAIGIFRLEKGQIVEGWEEVDMLGLMQQMGALPAP